MLQTSAANQRLLLVPSEQQRRGLRLRLRHLGMSNTRVVTFFELARWLLRQLGEPPLLLSGLRQTIALQRLFAQLLDQQQLPTYANVARKPGFIATVAELLADLANAEISPAQLAAAAQTSHDHELARIYAAYLAYQDQHQVADLARYLHHALTVVPQLAAQLSSLLLVVDGFDQFSPLQLALLRALALVGTDLVLTLTAEPRERPALRRFQQTRASLAAQFALNERWLQRQKTLPRPLTQLATYLFELDQRPAPCPAGTTVQLIEAADREREVRAVLRRVYHLLHTGTSPAAVALIYREGSDYLVLLREVAAEYQLPLAINDGLPLHEAPPVLALLQLLRLPFDDVPRVALFDLLTNPYYATLATLLPDPAALDAVARQAGLAGGLERWRVALAQPVDDLALAEQRLALQAAFEALIAWLTPPPMLTLAEYVAWVGDRLPIIAKSATDEQTHSTHLEALNDRDQQVLIRLRRLLEELTEAVRLFGAPQQTAHECLRELEAALRQARYRQRQRGVAVLSALMARGAAFEHVFVLGLSEGQFPRPLPEPAIYTRTDRRRLQALGVPLGAPVPADERSLFYEVLLRARSTLTLSRARLDETGTPLARSPYLNEALSLLESVPTEIIQAGSAVPLHAAISASERLIGLVLEHPEQLPTEQPHVARALAVEQWRESLADYQAYEGRLDDPTLINQIAATFGSSYEWSITELNDYLICPFRFAAAHVLQVAPLYEPEDELDSARRGQLYHTILARAAVRWRQQQIAPIPAHAVQALAVLDATTSEVLQTAPADLGFSPTIFWEWEQADVRRRLQAALEQLIAQESDWHDFTPALIEQGFGGKARHAALQVTTPHGSVLVRGRIDRIDRAPDGRLAVIDYKSSATPRPLGETLQGRDLQLPLYALAAAKIAGKTDPAEVDRAAFVHIGSGKRAALDQIALQTTLNTVGTRVGEVVAAVQRGDFRVRPHERCPEQCAFEPICRRNLEKRQNNQTE
jgi:ATP-dependent helicase/DNAse subunit B